MQLINATQTAYNLCKKEVDPVNLMLNGVHSCASENLPKLNHRKKNHTFTFKNEHDIFHISANLGFLKSK